MGTFLVYILKSAVCLAVFYLFYRLLLSKETFHRFNRIALLGVMVLSCLLPLIQVTVKEASPVNMQVMSMEDLLLMYQWNQGATVVEEGATRSAGRKYWYWSTSRDCCSSLSATSGRWDACSSSSATAGARSWTTASGW